MKQRAWITGFLCVWIAGTVGVAPAAAKEGKPRASTGLSQTSAKTYAYSEREKDSIRFFSVEKPRWDGYEVTTGDWDQLTDFLKQRYLRDARTEIEVRENSVILVNDMDRLVTAMDESIKELQDDPDLKKMPVITFFHIMLLQNNAIKKAWTLVKVSKAKTKL